MTTATVWAFGPITAGPYRRVSRSDRQICVTLRDQTRPLLASGAYFDEHQRADGKATDAPWDMGRSRSVILSIWEGAGASDYGADWESDRGFQFLDT